MGSGDGCYSDSMISNDLIIRYRLILLALFHGPSEDGSIIIVMERSMHRILAAGGSSHEQVGAKVKASMILGILHPGPPVLRQLGFWDRQVTMEIIRL